MLARRACRSCSSAVSPISRGCMAAGCKLISTSMKSQAGSSNSTSVCIHQQLLEWATGQPLEQLPVTVKQHLQHGRCLVAVRDIAAGEVLLSVSGDKAFSSKPGHQQTMHWAAGMALRLLQERHAAQHHSSSSSSSSFWQPWLSSLPRHVVTPVEFKEAEVQALVLPGTIQAVHKLQSSLEHCYAELQQQLEAVGCGWHDYLWAVQVLHSRCFLDIASGCHLAVPGIDMANHSSTAANAAVEMQQSPSVHMELSAVEGTAGTALPAGDAAAMHGTSCFQLVAGSEAILAGDQVSISYGSWPAEPFLLLWGFSPQPNPADAMVVFSSLQDMAACYFDCLQFKLTADSPAEQLLQSEQFFNAMKLQLKAAGGSSSSSSSSGFDNMSVDASGVDGRLKTALALLHAAIAAAAASALQQQHGSNSSSSDGHKLGMQPYPVQPVDGRSIVHVDAPGQQPQDIMRDQMHGDVEGAAVVLRQLQQLKLGELLVFRLQGLADDIEQSYTDCTASLHQLQARQQQQHADSSSRCINDQQQPQEGDAALPTMTCHTAQQDVLCQLLQSPVAQQAQIRL